MRSTGSCTHLLEDFFLFYCKVEFLVEWALNHIESQFSMVFEVSKPRLFDLYRAQVKAFGKRPASLRGWDGALNFWMSATLTWRAGKPQFRGIIFRGQIKVRGRLICLQRFQFHAILHPCLHAEIVADWQIWSLNNLSRGHFSVHENLKYVYAVHLLRKKWRLSGWLGLEVWSHLRRRIFGDPQCRDMWTSVTIGP